MRVLITSCFNAEEAVGYPGATVQDNHSKSSKGVLRGLHYQLPPHARANWCVCVAGEVFDVVMNIRKLHRASDNGLAFIFQENKRQLWIPEGFAHGFVTLTESIEFLYKTTNYYAYR
ncbi:dTDP-4-dehydrorhamnose 3,5-epimerase [Escherichia coli]|nr:dTDP-4-dehydrorhamnose 3,5-epimerase [Escherichia coli]